MLHAHRVKIQRTQEVLVWAVTGDEALKMAEAGEIDATVPVAEVGVKAVSVREDHLVCCPQAAHEHLLHFPQDGFRG